MRVGLTTLVVHDYDAAIKFFVDAIGFELISDDDQGAGKRWVVVGPPGERGGRLLLAQAVGAAQEAAVGNQTGGRVGHFLFAADFDEQYQRMVAAGVEFLEVPRSEQYGKVCVWQDLHGNKWDLLEDRA